MVELSAERIGNVTRGELLVKLRERLVSFAASRISRDQSEDLAQEVLVVLEEKYQDVERLEDLLPLSLRIMRFKLAAGWRKSERRGERSAIDAAGANLADPREDQETGAARAEMLERLRAALRKMEPRCRELFRLKLENRSFPEIRTILGARSINTVYTWDARCRQRLLELMGGRWEARRE